MKSLRRRVEKLEEQAARFDRPPPELPEWCKALEERREEEAAAAANPTQGAGAVTTKPAEGAPDVKPVPAVENEREAPPKSAPITYLESSPRPREPAPPPVTLRTHRRRMEELAEGQSEVLRALGLQ